MFDYFSPLLDKYPEIGIDKIKEFIVCGKRYALNNFKSIKAAKDFLVDNKLDITYMKYISNWIIGDMYDNITEIYLKAGKKHNLSGYAKKITEERTDKIEGWYYIDGIQISEDSFNKEVREYKLRRILDANN